MQLKKPAVLGISYIREYNNVCQSAANGSHHMFATDLTSETGSLAGTSFSYITD